MVGEEHERQMTVTFFVRTHSPYGGGGGGGPYFHSQTSTSSLHDVRVTGCNYRVHTANVHLAYMDLSRQTNVSSISLSLFIGILIIFDRRKKNRCLPSIQIICTQRKARMPQESGGRRRCLSLLHDNGGIQIPIQSKSGTKTFTARVS